MSVSDQTSNVILEGWVNKSAAAQLQSPQRPATSPKFAFAPLKPIRRWLDNVPINSSKLAHQICQRIPSQCPFERDVNLFGRTLFHIPPLCKLNPLYDELVSLRFRALCYLADECGEDVSAYC